MGRLPKSDFGELAETQAPFPYPTATNGEPLAAFFIRQYGKMCYLFVKGQVLQIALLD